VSSNLRSTFLSCYLGTWLVGQYNFENSKVSVECERRAGYCGDCGNVQVRVYLAPGLVEVNGEALDRGSTSSY
jgi:hypothetical protein